MDSYLNDDLVFDDPELLKFPLEMWKQIERNYPTIAIMAKDILSIPASGVGVERLFNTARDICHYRRNRLNADTIEMIMLTKWYEKLGLWTPGENTEERLSIEELSIEELSIDELPIDEQPATMVQEEVEWESESDDTLLDIDEHTVLAS